MRHVDACRFEAGAPGMNRPDQPPGPYGYGGNQMDRGGYGAGPGPYGPNQGPGGPMQRPTMRPYPQDQAEHGYGSPYGVLHFYSF